MPQIIHVSSAAIDSDDGDSDSDNDNDDDDDGDDDDDITARENTMASDFCDWIDYPVVDDSE